MTSLILIMALAAGTAASPAELYNQGNALYSAGDYPGAIGAYRQALECADHPHLRYNLGNAHFKDGQLGLAVIQYRLARAQAPRDPDIVHNLGFLRSYRVDRISYQPGPLESALTVIFTFFSSREAAILAGLCFLVASLLVSASLVNGRRWLAYLAIPAVLGFCYFAMVAHSWRAERASNPAVVTAKEASALSGPGGDFKEILLLHEGTEVRIRERRGDYLLVQLPGGIGGWVPQGVVERVY